MKSLREFVKSEDGPAAVEYAVMLGLVLLACIGAISSIGAVTGGSADSSAAKITGHMNEAMK